VAAHHHFNGFEIGVLFYAFAKEANVMLLGVAKEPRQCFDDLASYLVMNTDKVRIVALSVITGR
jgi:hypothetical protein